PQHELHAGEVQAELRRQPLDDPQPLDVGLGVEPGAAGRALRPHEALRLVDPQRLRVHADELGGDADHVHWPLVHHPSLPRASHHGSRTATTPNAPAITYEARLPSSTPKATQVAVA